MLKTLLCTLVLVTSSAAHAQNAARDLHDEAVDHLNEGRITEAAEVLQRLIDEHPDYYSGYRLYWDALGKVADEVAMREHVRVSLAKFERIPRDERTEDFYNAAMVGARYIEDEARKKVFEAEVIERFPRGLTAQIARLDAARDAERPREARSLYIAYMDAFPDNKSWVQLAARDCFGLMAKHSNTFTLDEMVEAAEAFDRTSVEYIPVYGNPTVRFAALVSISTTFLDRDPKRALAYADRGLEFVAEMAPQTDEFDETIGRNFDAVRFMAYAKLQRWAEVRKLARQGPFVPTRSLARLAGLPLGDLPGVLNGLGFEASEGAGGLSFAPKRRAPGKRRRKPRAGARQGGGGNGHGGKARGAGADSPFAKLGELDLTS